jgi:hypothetical protein
VGRILSLNEGVIFDIDHSSLSVDSENNMDSLMKKEIEETEIKIAKKESVINVMNFVLSDGGFGDGCTGTREMIDYFRQVKNEDKRKLEQMRDDLQQQVSKLQDEKNLLHQKEIAMIEAGL